MVLIMGCVCCIEMRRMKGGYYLCRASDNFLFKSSTSFSDDMAFANKTLRLALPLGVGACHSPTGAPRIGMFFRIYGVDDILVALLHWTRTLLTRRWYSTNLLSCFCKNL